MRRTLTWLLTLPFAAASVLAGHWGAYRLVGTPSGTSPGELHAYLAHAPQVVLILATLALLGLAADARSRRRSPVLVASLAAVAFVVQEHLERLAHTGELPFLLTSPVLWLGVAFQLPLAVAIWIVARRIADDLAISMPRPALRASLPGLLLPAVASGPRAFPQTAAHPARGPPWPS